MFKECTGLKKIVYKDVTYDKTTEGHMFNDFKTEFEKDGGTISTTAFEGSGII